MCGIAGIIGRSGHDLVDQMDSMLRALDHRGPDDHDVLCLSDGIIGHTRLAIVDLGGGHQPMSTHDARHHIVFNGEIYGYQDLRRQFHDFDFHTSSDTEIILASYERFGRESPSHLPGMFAFAIWDSQSRRLFCARDRFGEKPFYYALPEPGVIVFASELKAILASGLVKPEVDTCSVAYYMRRHYIHPWKTIYKNIHCLAPGHHMTWSQRDLEVKRYWKIETTTETTLDSAAEELRELLTDAVRNQLIADVEVGAFLSGGLDSTTVVGIAVDYSTGLRTFCADFDGQASEAPYARIVADRYGTRHSELRVGEYSLPGLLEELAYVYDEPFADNSNVPTYLISQLAREHVKVVLTGDGGDELFGGYGWYKALCWAEDNPSPGYWKWMVGRLVARAARTARLPFGDRLEERNIGIGMSRRNTSVMRSHIEQMMFCDDESLTRLGMGQCIPEINAWDYPFTDGENLAGAMGFDAQTFLPGDILVKIDRASMAHGLELRAPFLDSKVGEFALSLPGRLRVTKDEDKRVLRAAFSKSWPPEIRAREKHGFGAPVGRWLASPELSELLHNVVFDRNAAMYRLVDYEAVQKRYQTTTDYERWAILILGLWAERWSKSYRLAG